MSTVAIVGRPNVGKSTLFNRLVGMRQAIVDEFAGVTRDRHYGKSDWNGREFSVIDTGGYASDKDDVFAEEIRKQVILAIEESDLVLFLVDVYTGITDYDEEIAAMLRKSEKPVLVVANKVDVSERIYDSYEFNALGLGEPWCISSANGSGTGDLLDEVIRRLPQTDPLAEEQPDIPHLCIVGRPNVGKSSLTNALLGENRHIVTPVAGTTRDSIATYYNKFGHKFILIDTAGLRKKSKVTENIEFYSSMRAIRSIENSDVCILMLDAASGIESQDMSIYNIIVKNRKGVVIVVNKWDTVEKDNHTMETYRQRILGRLAPFTDVPLIFTSVIHKQRILNILDAAAQVFENRRRKIPTSKLNEALLPEIENFPPPATKGKFIKIKFVCQLPNPTPAFAFFCNLPQYVRDDYKRFLENKLRSHFALSGVPIQLFMRQK